MLFLAVLPPALRNFWTVPTANLRLPHPSAVLVAGGLALVRVAREERRGNWGELGESSAAVILGLRLQSGSCLSLLFTTTDPTPNPYPRGTSRTQPAGERKSCISLVADRGHPHTAAGPPCPVSLVHGNGEESRGGRPGSQAWFRLH